MHAFKRRTKNDKSNSDEESKVYRVYQKVHLEDDSHIMYWEENEVVQITLKISFKDILYVLLGAFS